MVMKNLITIFIVLQASFMALYADQEKDIKAPVKHVTVYPDRAQPVSYTHLTLPTN
jgi:hypothetical protein